MLSKDRKSHIHSLLVTWGEAVAGGVPGLPSPSSLLIAGTRAPQGSRVLWSADVEEMERAVNALPVDERAVVIELYTVLDSTTEQHCRALGCSVSKLYRMRDQAMRRISDTLREWQRVCG